MKYNKILFVLILPVIAAAISGCGKEAAIVNAGTGPSSGYLLESPPVEAPGLLAALENAQPGESFHFTGRVGGVREPITEGYAAFIVADESVVFCDEMGEDSHCPMPWDACCEDPGKLARSRALVQFSGANGLPLADDLTEAVGLSANDQVVIRGRLSADSVPGNPVIIAEGLAIIP